MLESGMLARLTRAMSVQASIMNSSDDKKREVCTATGEMKRANAPDGFTASSQLRRVHSKDYNKAKKASDVKKKEPNIPGQTDLHKDNFGKDSGKTVAGSPKAEAATEAKGGKEKKKGGCTIL